jgi:predicted ATP-dependent endonuclease of OLD family
MGQRRKEDHTMNPLKIRSIEVDNFMRLRSVRIEPAQDVQVIGGENEQGKTSLFQFVRSACGGAKETPDVPIRRGADFSHGTIDFGELSVEMVIDAKGRRVVVRNADGKKCDGPPQAILDAFYSKVAFRPLEFASKKPEEQQKILRGLVGLDFSELDAKRAKLYEQRTGVGRVRDDAEARVLVFPATVQSAPDAEVSVAELVQRKQTADTHNLKNARVRSDYVAACDYAGRSAQAVRDARAALDKALEQEAKDHAFQLEACRQLEACKDIETQSIVAAIASAETTNDTVRAKRDRAAAVAKFKEHDRQYSDITRQLEAIDAEKAEKMAKAPWPIPGLGFSDAGVTLNGLPFEQGSKAERMKVSLAIGAALNPNLRTMLLEDASLLDKSSMAIVHQVAREKDMQILVERVGSSDPGAIIIEDGEVANYSSEV